MEAEPYRALRHLVELHHRTSGLSVVVVSSPAAGDGKTTTAINLAGALAQDPGARVLLVDGDLRQSAVPQRLGLDGRTSPGLVDAILDPALTLDDLARSCPPYNLWLVPAGHRPGMPYELFASPRLGELLEAARRRFDYVVVDSSPLVLFPDCRLMAAWVDAFLVVVAAHRTPRKLVDEALTAIEPSKLLGLVFNGDDRPLVSRYYRYGYVRNGRGSGTDGERWLPRLGRMRRKAVSGHRVMP
jgi:capsular exopolysaccharide synthesis family protein